MAKITGTIRRSDLEGGLWILETTDGETYQLTGEIADAKDGLSVEVSGKVARDQMGFGMSGPQFAVTSIKDLSDDQPAKKC